MNLPSVRVPVLSKITVSAFNIFSRTFERVSRMPFFIRALLLAVSATGVARDSAQGQVTTSTERVTHSARSGSKNHHPVNTKTDIISKAKTKYCATLSANIAIAGFCSSPRSINSIMFEMSEC